MVIIAYGDDDNGDVVGVGIYVMRVMIFIDLLSQLSLLEVVIIKAALVSEVAR